MTKLYLIRHAEAEGNLYRRIHGHYDSLVTERGRLQIEDLRARFENISIDAVYSSDLIRTQVTASAIFKPKGLPLHTTPSLREVNMGVWEDSTWGEEEYQTPELLYYFNNDPEKWILDGSEHVRDVQRRMTDAILEIAEKHDGETIAIFSHGFALRTFLYGVLGAEPQDVRRVPHLDNTAVTLLHVESGAVTVEYLADNSHLSEKHSTLAHQRWWREDVTYDTTNMRYLPFDPERDAALYLECRRDSWMTVHGNLDGFSEDCARGMERGAIYRGVIGDDHAGLLELDLNRDSGEGVGYIEFYYMAPGYRRSGIGVQLLGQAVSVYRGLGRHTLRLRVERVNSAALRFYQKYGFYTACEEDSILVLEKDIQLRVLC